MNQNLEEALIIIALILLNGIFSLSEIAVISARKSSLSSDSKRGNKSAQVALKLADNPDRFLSTVQIGITLIGILTGIFSGAAIVDHFASLLNSYGLSEAYSYQLAQIIIVVIVTYLTILFGELVPKRIGLSASEKAAKIMARPMNIVAHVAAPFVWLLSKSTEMVVKFIGIERASSKVTEEEIKSIVQEGKEDGTVQEVEQDIVERVFLLGDLRVNSLMTHRQDVIAIDIHDSKETIEKTIEDNLYEAYPVIDKSLDNLLGYVPLKNLILRMNQPNFQISDTIQPATYFHENMSVYKALEQMKEKRLSQVLVCDEFGSFQGLITLRDILEGLVGTINDQGEEPDIILREDKQSWLADGQCSFYTFLSYFEMEDLYQSDQSYNTLAGLLIEQLKRIPKAGEQVEWMNFHFEIVDMDGARIDKVIITKKRDE
jgi:putative hemolysin